MDTVWLELLKAGKQDAATQLWNEYIGRLLQLARRKLASGERKIADEEDVVLSAFNSFCRGAAEGRFAKLDDRNDLWQVLAMITTRKAIRQLQRERAAKRGGGQVRGESVFGGDSMPGIQETATGGPSPEFQAVADEEFERLLDLLPGDELKQIAVLKLEGYTNEQIGEKISRHSRSVERKLQLIRKHWESEVPEDSPD